MNAPNGFTRPGIILTVVLAFFGPAVFAHADTNSTRAARLTYVQGTVTVNEPNGGDSVPAQLNLPLLTGVQLVTGNDGQAEVEFEDGSIVRLTPNSALSLDNLAIQADGVFLTNLSLLHGLVYCELRATPQYRYWINVGGDILSPVENTTVRINFDEPPAIFSVLDGTAEVERHGTPNSDRPNAGFQTQVRAGESLSADRTGNRYFLTQQIAADSWDQWNEDRDQAASADAADSTPVRNDYAGAEGYGWSDLDANGNWYNVPGQGTVWQPQIAVNDPNFDPYGNGAWVFYPNSGYLWASSYSWGWTPYRCGNWSYYNSFGWGWAPGAGCGNRGWGFAGGGRPVNIVIGPTGYRPIRVPVSGSPHPRPIWPVHTPSGERAEPFSGLSRGPRRIAGVTAEPIAREHHGPEAGEGRSALRRDFPIDSRSKAPVLGLASTSPTVVRPNSGLHTVDQRSRPDEARQSDRMQGQPDTYGGRRYPSNVQPDPSNAGSQSRGGRPDPSASEPRRTVEDSSPARPAMDRYPSYRRPADNGAPNQPPANQNASPRRPAEDSTSAPRPAEPSPSYQRNIPQPTVRAAPPADRPVERSSPPPAAHSAPPPSPPPAPRSAPTPPPPPAPVPHPTTQSAPAKANPN
ncbi:MAG: FecR domain-containing protein [Acidobacteriota bacterium]|nr:FecR domain-containing protein [Acidobacteriota bacterium]